MPRDRLASAQKNRGRFQVGKRRIAALALVLFAIVPFKPFFIIPAVRYTLLFDAYWRTYDEHQKKYEKNEQELIVWLASHEDQAGERSIA
jgi:flagellar biosynthesis component FlhA